MCTYSYVINNLKKGAFSVSLKRQTILLSLALGFFVLVEGLVLFNSNQHILFDANQIANVNIPTLNKAHRLKLTVVQVQQWLTDISATRGLDGLNDGFDEAQKNAVLFKSLIAELKSIDPERVDTYNNMSSAFDLYFATGVKMAQAYVDGGPEAGNMLMASFDDAAAKLTNQVDPFLDDVMGKINIAIADQESTSKTAGKYILIASLLIIALVSIIAYIISNAVAALPKLVAEMASGDLTSSFDLDREDEIGEIMKSLEQMKGKLLGMVSGLSTSTVELSQSSDDLARLALETNSNIHSQFSQIGQVASATSEMSATVQSVASSILETADAASNANEETTKGQQIVNETIAEINSLSNQIEQASGTVNQFETDTDNITSVLEVIGAVAEQTNLLALNAAIEAARAGEQGRGFAVVADEVRTLAGRTQQATEEINKMIDKLSLASRAAVKAMQQSQEQAKSAVAKASETGASLSSITNAVSNINEMCAHIASTSEQQSVVANEINQSIERINDMSRETGDNIAEVSESSEKLSQISGGLKNMVSEFKTTR